MLSNIFEAHMLNNSYVSAVHRLVYVATPKVACTSLKWWFADLVGCSTKSFQTAARFSREPDPELVIHDLFQRVAPEVANHDLTEVLELIKRSDYFSFCLVRNPFVRVFSAWQSKWLIREPLQIKCVNGAAFDTWPIESTEDLRRHFEGFLEYLAAENNNLSADPHVLPQSDLLEPDIVRYDLIARIEDTSLLEERLAEHLGEDYRSPFSTQHANISLLNYSSDFFTERSVHLTRQVYARDLALFGYADTPPVGAPALTPVESKLVTRAIKLLRARSERLLDFQQEIMSLEARMSATVESAVLKQLEMQLFFSEFQNDGGAAHFAEVRSSRCSYLFDGDRQAGVLHFPSDLQPLERLRLDIANAPVAIILHGLSLQQATGEEVWRWDGQSDVFVKQGGIICLPEKTGGTLLLCINNDPQFELDIPKPMLALARGGAILRCEFTPRPILEQLPAVLAQLQQQTTGVPALADGHIPVGFSRYLDELGSLLKVQIDRKNATITAQHTEIESLKTRQQMLYDQVVRAEAQLDLLKELCLSEFGQRQERL